MKMDTIEEETELLHLICNCDCVSFQGCTQCPLNIVSDNLDNPRNYVCPLNMLRYFIFDKSINLNTKLIKQDCLDIINAYVDLLLHGSCNETKCAECIYKSNDDDTVYCKRTELEYIVKEQLSLNNIKTNT